jgi:hypothetical protein
LAEATSSDPYHRLNALQLAAVLRLIDTDDQEQAGELPVSDAGQGDSDDQGDGTSPPKPEQAPSFWKRATRGDHLLTTLLDDASRRPRSEPIPPETRELWTATSSAIVRAYSDAFRLRSSERERASVIDHVDDLAALLPVDHAVTDVLQATAKALHAWPTVLHPPTPAPVDGLPAAASHGSASNEASPATGTDDGSPP